MTTNKPQITGCHCSDVALGSYDNQITMTPPFELRNCLGEKKLEWKACVDGEDRSVQLVCLDTCLATEIGWLWNNGVKTLECCCGHKKICGYIAVDKKSVKKMEELGYKHLSQEERSANNKQFFYPITI